MMVCLPLSIQMTVPSTGIPQSLTKTMLAFACYIGLDVFQFNDLIGFLGNKNVQDFYQPYYMSDVVLNRQQLPFHCVGISSKNPDGLLLGYIEYFGAYRYLFKLATQWDMDRAIHSCYAIDPINGSTIDLEIDLSLNGGKVAEVMSDRSDFSGEIKKALDAVIPLGLPDPLEALQNIAIDFAFKECGVMPGQDLPREKYEAFSGICSNKLIHLLMEHGFMGNDKRQI